MRTIWGVLLVTLAKFLVRSPRPRTYTRREVSFRLRLYRLAWLNQGIWNLRSSFFFLNFSGATVHKEDTAQITYLSYKKLSRIFHSNWQWKRQHVMDLNRYSDAHFVYIRFWIRFDLSQKFRMKSWNSSITELRITRFHFAYVQQFAVLIINTINSLLTHELCIVEKKVEEINIH